MGLTQQEEKYINLTLSDLYERALEYKRMLAKPFTSRRDKATLLALATDASRTFNFALKTLGMVGTSKISQEQVLLLNNHIRDRGFNPLDKDDIDAIHEQAFGVSSAEREALRIKLNREYAQAFVISQGTSQVVKDAINTLIKHGEFDKLIPADKILELSQRTITPTLPRGNPIKGGLVKKYMGQGKPRHEAHYLADKDIVDRDRAMDLAFSSDPNPQFQTEKLKPKMTVEEAQKLMVESGFTSPNFGEQALDILTRTEITEATETKDSDFDTD